MKNLIASFLFLLVSNFVFGQIEWVGNHDFSEAATDIVRTSQGQYVLVHGDGSGFTVLDTDGTVIFEKLLNVYQTEYYSMISDVVELSDSSIVLTVSTIDCDVLVDRFYRFDKAWNEVSPYQYAYSTAGPAAVLNDNTIVFGYENANSLSKYDKYGNEIWQVSLFFHNITDLIVIPDDTILVATMNGLHKVTTDGVVVEAFTNLVFDRLDLLPNGNFLAQTNDLLLLYELDYTQLASFQLQGDSIVNLAFDEQAIAVLSSDSRIIRLDNNLNQIGQTTLTGHNQVFTTLEMTENGYLVGGSEKYGNDQHGNKSAFIKEFTLDGATAITGKDAALNQVSVTGQITVLPQWYPTLKMTDILLTVENMGTTTIDGLQANVEFPGVLWGECFPPQTFTKRFGNLNLQPGAAATLVWDSLSVLFDSNPTGNQVELCFWTSLPDHQLETNNDNDVSCTEVLVAAHEPFPISFSHAFNAVADVLFLEMLTDVDFDNAKANIFNAAGQLVHAENITSSYQTLQLQDLSDGVYFLQIVSGQRVGWGKFAKF